MNHITKRISAALIIILLIIATCISIICLQVSPPVKSVGSVRLNIETYRAGDNQPTHPSVYAFDTPWNGYTYWMAYSPYPYANGEEENPCIAVSNDLRYWETPTGIVNPIAYNEETGCDELKDPHLVYREDLDRIEVWYLGRLSTNLGGDGTSLLLMRKYSSDGVHWSNYEIMSKTEYLSPTVIWDGVQYQLWAIGYDLWNTTGTFIYQESLDGMAWSDPVCCSIEGQDSGLDMWHGAVTKYHEMYYFVFIGYDKQRVFCCTSPDGVSFGPTEVIVDNDGYWDFLYRPTLLIEDDTVTCFYGIVNQENQWYLSLSSGESIDTLSGLRENDVALMAPLSDTMVDTHMAIYNLRTLFYSVEYHFRIELLVIVFFEVIVVLLLRGLGSKRWFFVLCIFANFVFTSGYILYRFLPSLTYDWFGAILAICILNIMSDCVLYFARHFRTKN